MIHIGQKIRKIVETKGIRVSWLAQQLCCERRNIYHIYSRSTIDTELLLRLSEVLDYDFFADISSDFQSHKMSENAHVRNI